MGKPRGFFKLSGGQIVWARGTQYIRDGSNPFRTEVDMLLGHHGLCMQSAGDNELTTRATPGEVRLWLVEVAEFYDARKAAIRREATEKCDRIDSMIRGLRSHEAECLVEYHQEGK